MENVLEVSKLTKQFGQFTAVDDISFSIIEGEIVGLLGPNGAGKTTTIQMLLGLVTPTSGSISYFGRNFQTHREYCLSHINFTSAYAHVQGKLTVLQNLKIFAGLYGMKNPEKRIDELIALLHIEETKHKLFWKLSSGQKTRVNIVKSLLNSPKLLLMDEPTASLDPEIVNKVLELVVNLQKKEGLAILYTSHNMTEVERICDRVMFLDHGKIVAEDTPLGLSKRAGKATLIITFDGEKHPVSLYLESEKLSYSFMKNHVVKVEVTEEEIPKVLFGFSSRKIWVTNIDIEKPDLEDVFLSIARGEAHEFKQN